MVGSVLRWIRSPPPARRVLIGVPWDRPDSVTHGGTKSAGAAILPPALFRHPGRLPFQNRELERHRNVGH